MKFKTARTKKDIENDPRVISIHQEDDGCWENSLGWWCYIKAGWMTSANNHTIHERTIRDVCDEVNSLTEWPDDPDRANTESE